MKGSRGSGRTSNAIIVFSVGTQTIFTVKEIINSLLDIGLNRKRVGFAIIATLGRWVGDRCRVVTNTERTLQPIL